MGAISGLIIDTYKNEKIASENIGYHHQGYCDSQAKTDSNPDKIRLSKGQPRAIVPKGGQKNYCQ